jgi:hypothetical protein
MFGNLARTTKTIAFSILLNQSKRSIQTTSIKSFLFRSSRHVKTQNYLRDHHIVNGVYTEAGAILPVPKWYKFGITKVIVVVTAYILLGSFVSQATAEFLEDNEIFVPDEEDD